MEGCTGKLSETLRDVFGLKLSFVHTSAELIKQRSPGGTRE